MVREILLTSFSSAPEGARFMPATSGTASTGQARIYEWNKSGWVKLGSDIQHDTAAGASLLGRRHRYQLAHGGISGKAMGLL